MKKTYILYPMVDPQKKFKVENDLCKNNSIKYLFTVIKLVR